MVEIYKSSPERIANRVVSLYTQIKNNPVWYTDNSYFAAAITSTTQSGNVYTAKVIAYGDQNTAANGRQDDDWISYTMTADYNNYTLVDASITGIAAQWATFVNTPAYYIIVNAPVYVDIKNEQGIAVGLANGIYTKTSSRHQVTSTGTRLFYSYKMDLMPVMLTQVAYIPVPSALMSAVDQYIGCVIKRGDCGGMYNAIQSSYAAFVASAKNQATQPTSPELWQLMGLTDSGEDYIDIDTNGNITGGRLTYWGITVPYNPNVVNPVQLGVGNVSYYMSLKKIPSAQYLRHTRTDKLTTLYFISKSGIGKMTFDTLGNLVA